MWILLSIVLITFFAAGFGIVFAKFNTEYTPQETDTFQYYNKSAELNVQLSNIKTNVTEFKEKTTVTDRIGNFFGSAYSVLISIPTALDLMYSLVDQGLSDLHIEGAGLIKWLLISVLSIFVFVGILLAILLKTDRI